MISSRSAEALQETLQAQFTQVYGTRQVSHYLPSPKPFAREITELKVFAQLESPVRHHVARDPWKQLLRTGWQGAKMQLCIGLARLIDAIVLPTNAHAVSLPRSRRADVA